MIDTNTIRLIEAQAKCLHPAHDVDEMIAGLGSQISEKFQDMNPIVLCIMTGGVVFCGKLLPHLSFPLEFDYAHATRYNDDIEGGDILEWRALPTRSLDDRHVLIVDDIFDVGHTLAGVVESCKAQGALSVSTAVMVNKNHDRKYDPKFKADFVAFETGDYYLFGYGMDYKGYLRNAPGIFSVNED